jgi:biotin operon repressor
MTAIHEPETLTDLHELFVKSLKASRVLVKAEAAKSITVSKRRDGLVFRANLPELSKKNIRLDVSSDTLSLRRHSQVIFAVEIKAFPHSATFREDQFELKVAEQQVGKYGKHAFPIDAPAETYEAVRRVLKTAEEPVRKVFITRALNAVADLSEGMKDVALEAASAAPSDFSVLVRALENPEATANRQDSDPLLPARLRGIETRQKLLDAEGGVTSAEEVARLLSISRQAVDKRRRSGRLIGVTRGRHGYAYPMWQFDENGTIHGLEAVLSKLRHHDPWMQMIFMLSPNSRLEGRTPLAVLKEKNIDAVLAAAGVFGEHGAA